TIVLIRILIVRAMSSTLACRGRSVNGPFGPRGSVPGPECAVHRRSAVPLELLALAAGAEQELVRVDGEGAARRRERLPQRGLPGHGEDEPLQLEEPAEVGVGAQAAVELHPAGADGDPDGALLERVAAEAERPGDALEARVVGGEFLDEAGEERAELPV